MCRSKGGNSSDNYCVWTAASLHERVQYGDLAGNFFGHSWNNGTPGLSIMENKVCMRGKPPNVMKQLILQD